MHSEMNIAEPDQNRITDTSSSTFDVSAKRNGRSLNPGSDVSRFSRSWR